MIVPEKGLYLNNKELLIAVRESKENGKMSNKLAKMLQLLCAKYATKGNFVNYCVDTQTQALTKQGWKSYNTISIDDIILSYNTKTQSLTWSNILDIFKNDYNGPMHRLSSNKINALVTPHHKFVKSSTPNLSDSSILPIEQFLPDDYLVIMGNALPNNSSAYSDDLVRLIGWIISIGDISTNSITLSTGIKLDKIKALFHSTNYQATTTQSYNSTTITYQSDLIHDINLMAPNGCLSMIFINQLTESQRTLLLSIISANSYHEQDYILYFNKDKNHIDAIAILCTLAGMVTTTNKYPTGHLITIYTDNQKTLPFSSINQHNNNQSNTSPIPTIPYNNLIWCPKTEYGNFVCRRGNNIYITGNTYNEDMQAYAMFMLARTWNSFNPEKSNNPFAFFTQCIKNSFIQYLNQEKRQRNIRDLLLVDQGLNPSHTFTEDNTDQHYVEDEQDFYYHKETAKTLHKQLSIDEEVLFNEEDLSNKNNDYLQDIVIDELKEDDDEEDLDQRMLLI